MYEDSLFVSMEDTMDTQYASSSFFISFINRIEGWKTKCKNLHLCAPQTVGDSIHTRLDEFLENLCDFQDSIAEDYQATLGDMSPNSMVGIPCECINAMEFINDVLIKTKLFYKSIPNDIDYVGIKSETESFIHNIKKYIYLFKKCSVR